MCYMAKNGHLCHMINRSSWMACKRGRSTNSARCLQPSVHALRDVHLRANVSCPANQKETCAVSKTTQASPRRDCRTKHATQQASFQRRTFRRAPACHSHRRLICRAFVKIHLSASQQVRGLRENEWLWAVSSGLAFSPTLFPCWQRTRKSVFVCLFSELW
ncbi:MAG: hypothetical protein BWX80_02718 [Candidatus Hydrogenedentes bacterium ADurb.Bin101]|jgi:hypothetical protein|nr:MAG: hypothetical protein BWX80_02718 [Candidatus Hydrogenedentes bacterium ADurb.Bin101]